MASNSSPVPPGASGNFVLPIRSGALRDANTRHPPIAPSAFDLALAEYTQQDYRAAFDALARLADRGHPHAARIALLMVEHGTRLHGGRFEASIATRQRWRALAAPRQEAA